MLRISLALLVAAALAPSPALSQTIYIYTDEAGVTHFTDRKPDTDREVIIQRAVAETKPLFDLNNRGSDREPRWVFTNRLHGHLEVEVRLAEADNVVSEPRLPGRFVLPPAGERELVVIGPLEAGRSWRYRIQAQATAGNPDAEPDTDYPYRPPFAPGQSFRISQGFGGSFSHRQPHSYHAVDFDMPAGTPVYAARSGVVMEVARFFDGSGEVLERYGDRANFVRVEHDDGTMAVYAHLEYEGVQVRPGQRVEKGQDIGRSGDTGFATGPHLHFVVQKNAGMRLESVPFVFAGANGSTREPSRGDRFRAAP